MGDNAEKYLNQLKALFSEHLKSYPDVHLYLFGSRARGDAGRCSDIDIGLLGKEKLDDHIVRDLKSIAEESYVPYEVDVVDLSTVSEAFKNAAMKEAILWNKD